MQKLSAEDIEFLRTYDPKNYEKPSVTVDILIFTAGIGTGLELLLIRRKAPPFRGMMAIPGGFVNMDESVEDAAARELFEETGVSGLHLEQLYTFGNVGRDPRMRVISVAYMALVPKNLLKVRAGDDAAEADFYPVSLEDGKLTIGDGAELAFDHDEIIRLAVERLRSKLSYTDIALELVGDKNRFSIYELQKINEAILGKSVDTANFRRSFTSSCLNKGIAEETGEPCTEFSRRASKYYRVIKGGK